MSQTPAKKMRGLAQRYASQGKPRLAEAWRLAAEEAEQAERRADVECSACGAMYVSGEGHPAMTLCPRCVAG